jgi:hypothetical protein
MSKFFTASTKQEDVAANKSSYVNGSGFYPVNIIAPVVSVSKNGSTTIDFFVEHDGQKQIIYGDLRITNNDGNPNKVGSKLFNQLVVIAGLDDVAEPIEAELPIGKKEAMKTVAILEDLADIDVIMRVQMTYGMYNGKITEKKVIKAFYRSDKATAEEVLSGENIGAGYEREQKYANNVTYNDDLTAEAVQAWIAGGRKEDGAPAATTKKAPSFGTKRFGAK